MRAWWTLVVTSVVVACDGGSDGGDTDTDGGSRVDAILALTGDPAAGETVYTGNCELCHGENGNDGTTGDDLTEAAAATDRDAELAEVILEGRGAMAGLGSQLTDKQIADVLAYLHNGLFE